MAEEKELENTSEELENEVLEELNEEKEENKEEQTEEVQEEVEETTQEQTEEVEEEYNGPVVNIHTQYDYRTMKYFNMYNMIYRKHFQIVYIIMGLISLGVAGYSTYNALSAETIQIINFVLPAIFVLFGVYFIYQAICFEKVIDKNISMHFYKNPKVVNISVTVTERDVTLQIIGNSKSEPFKYDWAYITEIVEIPQFFFLYVQKQPIIVEKDPNKITEGDYDTLVSIIMEKTATKPYKKIDKDLVTKPITYVHADQNSFDDAEEAEVKEVEEDVEVKDEVNEVEVENNESDTSDNSEE